jgi:hypothetical protein
MPDFCQVMGLPYAVTRDQSQRVPKIAAYDEVNLPDGLASLGVILDRTDSSLAERIMKGCPCWVRVVPGEGNET